MKRADALEALGFGRTSDPSLDEIKKAYQKKARQYHPDKNVNNSEDEQKKCTEKFKEVSNAWEFLQKPRHEQEAIEAKENEGNQPVYTGMDTFRNFYYSDELFSPFAETFFQTFFTFDQKHHNLEIKISSLPETYLLSFNNAFELENGTNTLFQHARTVKEVTIRKRSQTTIPEEVMAGLVRSLEKISTLNSLNDFSNALSPHQKQRIQETIRLNTLFKDRITWAFCAGAAVAGVGYLMSAASAVISFAFLATYFTTGILIRRYHHYATQAKSAYDSVEKIKQIVDPTEQEALQMGVKAENWAGYFQSYKCLASYKKHAAFTAGKEIGLAKIRNAELIDEIENFKGYRV